VLLKDAFEEFTDSKRLWRVESICRGRSSQEHTEDGDGAHADEYGGTAEKCGETGGKRLFHCNAWKRRNDVLMTMENFRYYMNQQDDEDPLYLFDNEVPPWLSRAARTPRFFQDDLLDALRSGDGHKKSCDESREDGDSALHRDQGSSKDLDDTEQSNADNSASSTTGRRRARQRRRKNHHRVFTETKWLLIGPSGSGTKFHFDPHAVAAWNMLTQGRKLWFFWPPLGHAEGRWLARKDRAENEVKPPRKRQRMSHILAWGEGLGRTMQHPTECGQNIGESKGGGVPRYLLGCIFSSATMEA